ncbi:MAG: hypothetical protein JO041_14010 [Acidobacteria bacterium]|nr:hypothetical protein [Acidobacteriota bacterium]
MTFSNAIEFPQAGPGAALEAFGGAVQHRHDEGCVQNPTQRGQRKINRWRNADVGDQGHQDQRHNPFQPAQTLTFVMRLRPF